MISGLELNQIDLILIVQGLVPLVHMDYDKIRVGVQIDSNDPTVPRQIRHVIDTRIGRKNSLIKFDQDSFTLKVFNLPQDQSECSLDEERIMRLGQVGLKIGQLFSVPQRIHWGMSTANDDDEELYVFGCCDMDEERFFDRLQVDLDRVPVARSEVEFNELQFIKRHKRDRGSGQGGFYHEEPRRFKGPELELPRWEPEL